MKERRRTTMITNLPTQVVGNMGMYYACYKLSLMGWNVMPTARNAKGIDIVAYNQSGKQMIGIQVKALSKSRDIALGSSSDEIMGDFWIVITNVVEKPIAYILELRDVKKLASPTKTGAKGLWLIRQRKRPTKTDTYENEIYKEAWGKIGRGDCD